MLDHLSENLKALYPGRPAKGEIRKYKLTGIRKRNTPEGGQSFTMPNSRSLPTSYPIMDGDEVKSIVYVSRVLPTDDPNKTRQELGWVEFRIEDACEISVSHENYNVTKNDDMFLFFSPFLEGSETKPWYLRHKLGKFVLLESPELIAADFVDVDQTIHKAKAVVYKMSKEMMGIVISQLKLGSPERLSDMEMRQKLLQYSQIRINGQAGGGAKRILILSENKDVALRRLIKTAINIGTIKGSDSGSDMIWVQGGGSICPKLAGKTLEDSMIAFFVSNDGREVLGSIKAIVVAAQMKAENLKNKLKQDKKNPVPPSGDIRESALFEKIANEKKPPVVDKLEGDVNEPDADDIPDISDIGKVEEDTYPEGEDEFGPLPGTAGWNKCNPQRKGVLNKKRKLSQLEKDTSLPTHPESPKEAVE